MRSKGYLLGLGTGIIILSIIFFWAYSVDARGEKEQSSATMTDEEIRMHAVRLGMVQLSDIPETASLSEMTDEDIITRASVLGMTFPTDSPTNEPSSGDKSPDETGEDINGSQETGEDSGIENTGTQMTDANGTRVVDAGDHYIVEIPEGIGTTDIANILADAGVIPDAGEFSRYIVRQNRATVLHYGRYHIPKGTSHSELLAMLTRENISAVTNTPAGPNLTSTPSPTPTPVPTPTSEIQQTPEPTAAETSDEQTEDGN